MNSESIFLSIIFPLTSVAGLAQLLRSGEPLSNRAIASVCLNSGLFGVSVASLLLHRLGVDSWALIVGISVLAGLGGNAMVDLGVSILKRIAMDKFANDKEEK